MKKLWQKTITLNQKIESFTIGKDRQLDLLLAPYDVQGTLAHIEMLCNIGLIEQEELKLLNQIKNYQKIGVLFTNWT